MGLCHHRMSSSETFCVLSLFSFTFLYNATTSRKTSLPKVKQYMLREQCSCCTAGCGGGALRALLLQQCT